MFIFFRIPRFTRPQLNNHFLNVEYVTIGYKQPITILNIINTNKNMFWLIL